MKTTELEIPTYSPDADVDYDYNQPHTLTLEEVDGLRVVMGDPNGESSPDVVIERAADRWRVFVHADRTDPFCIVEISKDSATVEDHRGKLFLERELD